MAIAPLLVIWFGPGMFSKVLICALIVFFPVLVNTVVGLRAVPENLRDLMRSLHATRGQMLRYLEIPAALPVLLGGLRIGRHPVGHRRGGGRIRRRGPRPGLSDQRGARPVRYRPGVRGHLHPGGPGPGCCTALVVLLEKRSCLAAGQELELCKGSI